MLIIFCRNGISNSLIVSTMRRHVRSRCGPSWRESQNLDIIVQSWEYQILLMAYGDEDHQRTGRLLSSAYIGAGVMTYGIKRLTRRKRPLDETLGNPSLPSGHATIAFSAATILGYRYPKWRIPLYIGAGLVGFSRIYLGRHYTSDVLTGAAIGTAMGVIVWNNRVTLLQWEF